MEAIDGHTEHLRPLIGVSGVNLTGHGNTTSTFQPMAARSGTSLAAGTDVAFRPLAGVMFCYADSATSSVFLETFQAAPSAIPDSVFSVSFSEVLGLASVYVQGKVVDALAAAQLALSSRVVSDTLQSAFAVSIISIGAVTPTYESPGTVWVLNDDSGATSTYTNYPFNSYAVLGGRAYGLRADGLYLLEGSNDAGANIRASVAFGKQDFGTTINKRVTDVYIGVASDGQLLLKVITADQDEFVYVQQRSSPKHQVQRFVPGKQLHGNFLAFELFTNDNTTFDLSSIEFTAVPLTRRI